MIFQITAFIILAVFYGCYFIKMFRQSKKGIKTNMLGIGKSGFVLFIEIGVKTVTIVCFAAEVFSIIFTDSMSWRWLRILGACIGVIGAAVFIISAITMHDNWRAGVPEKKETTLVTGGIYRISRNPAFLGFDLVYIGILLMFFNYGLLTVSIAAAAMLHLQIVNVEEDFLIAEFGEEYLNYKKHVRRYIGRK